jgi:hypothetical protein
MTLSYILSLQPTGREITLQSLNVWSYTKIGLSLDVFSRR